MKKSFLASILMLSLTLNVVLIYRLGYQPPAPQAETNPEATATTSIQETHETGASYPFMRVVDGDTVIVGIEGKSEYVRLIGIDSPEPNDPGGPECYATEATEHLKDLTRTGTVVLHFDESQGMRDTYGRLLAYVELPDGTDLGAAMLRDGYAHEYTYNQPYARHDIYTQAETEAVSKEAGLWSTDTCPAN